MLLSSSSVKKQTCLASILVGVSTSALISSLASVLAKSDRTSTKLCSINIWMYSSSQYKNLHPFYPLRCTILHAFYLSKYICIQTCFSIQVHAFLDKWKSSILERMEYTIKILSQHNQSNPRAQPKIWSGSSSFCRHVGHPASRSCHERKQSGS